MLQFFRVQRWLRLAATLTLGGAGGVIPAAAAAPTNEELAAAALPAPRNWELSGNLRGALGYKENVLLSAVRVEDSAFAQSEAEIFWWCLPTERFEAMAFASGTFTRYFDSEENPRETQAFAHAEARCFASSPIQVTVVTEGYHLDQVFDLSETHADRLTQRLAMHGGLAHAAVRWDFWRGGWLELKPGGQRDRFRDGSDDNRQLIGRATLGALFFGGRLELAASGQRLRRDYDRRVQYTAGGRPLGGTDLTFEQREGELRVEVKWGERKRWSTSTSARWTANHDNGSGYFDYQYRSIRQEIAWDHAPWKVRLAGRAGRFDYDVQTEGIGINPPFRFKEEHLVRLRLERRLSVQALLYADWQLERSRSNDPLANYRVKTATAGLDWAF